MNPMVLSVPARPEWTMVLRMAVSGVCALYDLPLDVMDDLKPAIDESCELLLHQDYQAETLTLRCTAERDGLHVCLNASMQTRQSCPDAADADIARLIIGTLVRDVDLERDEHGVRGVHMILPACV